MGKKQQQQQINSLSSLEGKVFVFQAITSLTGESLINWRKPKRKTGISNIFRQLILGL